jgi:hypothetical protein
MRRSVTKRTNSADGVVTLRADRDCRAVRVVPAPRGFTPGGEADLKPKACSHVPRHRRSQRLFWAFSLAPPQQADPSRPASWRRSATTRSKRPDHAVPRQWRHIGARTNRKSGAPRAALRRVAPLLAGDRIDPRHCQRPASCGKCWSIVGGGRRRLPRRGLRRAAEARYFFSSMALPWDLVGNLPPAGAFSCRWNAQWPGAFVWLVVGPRRPPGRGPGPAGAGCEQDEILGNSEGVSLKMKPPQHSF